jgi:phospholipid-transporting ATPase
VFSGAIIYESWTLSLYNVFFTVLPPLAMGILDQFVSARLLDRYPQLYNLGQSNQFFRLRVFVSWIANAVYHSLILYIFGVLLWPWDLIQGDGKLAGHWVWGTGMYGAVLLTVLGKAGLVTNNWTKYHVIAIPGSMAFWIAFIAAYATVAPMVNVSKEYFGTVPRIFSSPVFWLQILVLPVLCLLRDVGYKYAKRMYRPQNYHHIQEIQKYNIQDYRPRYVLLLTVFDSGWDKFANGTCVTEWNNSKKRSARYDKSSVCASREGMPSRRRTSRRHACSRRTTRRRTEEGTERWPRRGRIRER